MTEHLYRFRSKNYMLEELQNQEIYFATRKELNDPIEGFKDMFWNGDEVIWGNFFKHYLLCLEHVFNLFMIHGEDCKIDDSTIPVLKTAKDLPTKIYSDLYKEICELFLSNETVKILLKSFVYRTNPMHQKELCFYLKQLHLYALNTIFTVYEKHSIMPKRPDNDPLRQEGVRDFFDSYITDWINDKEAEHLGIGDASEWFYAYVRNIYSQHTLIIKYNSQIHSTQKNWCFILAEFHEKYIEQLEKLVHPEWYVASFSANCSNPSMWGHYGDHHKGICLKFRTNLFQGKPYIKLHRINGWSSTKEKSGPIYGDVDHQFYKVDYTKRYPEIDFFKSLGCITMPNLSEWYRDEKGNKSSCADVVYEDEEKWRDKYWADFQSGQTTKLEDWSYEEEYRLILRQGMVNDFSGKTHRKLKYNFKALEGIVFGIETPEQDKLEVIKIIEDKCHLENRNDFKFYQAYYSIKDGNIKTLEMNLLKFY